MEFVKGRVKVYTDVLINISRQQHTIHVMMDRKTSRR